MASHANARTTRWILLFLALLLSIWFWRQSSQSAPTLPSVFIPTKLYEPSAVACTDNIGDDPRPVSM